MALTACLLQLIGKRAAFTELHLDVEVSLLLPCTIVADHMQMRRQRGHTFNLTQAAARTQVDQVMQWQVLAIGHQSSRVACTALSCWTWCVPQIR